MQEKTAAGGEKWMEEENFSTALHAKRAKLLECELLSSPRILQFPWRRARKVSTLM
jgi:hypothetical protein